jgi:hypothetical protein
MHVFYDSNLKWSLKPHWNFLNLIIIIICCYMLQCLHSEIVSKTCWTWGSTVDLNHVVLLLLWTQEGFRVWGGNSIHNEYIVLYCRESSVTMGMKLTASLQMNEIKINEWLLKTKHSLTSILWPWILCCFFFSDLHILCMVPAKCP